ncbi:MAG: ABC transporter ATP-binding protein [Gammaproteobacteria bacterium]|nr:MAG: ABC transporter ATP-binding protein [Gammaproteobacteria bacterium]
MLEFKQVVAGYTHPVIGPVSFSIEAGEVVGLSGRNGIGKSTLFRALSGEARLFGGGIRRQPGLRLAHHRQEPVRPEENPLTGTDLLAVNRAPAPARDHRLTPLLSRRIDQLSGGQLQLLELWCALSGPANLILLDEPTHHLDHEAHEQLADMLGKARERQCAVLVISHEPEFCKLVCSRQIGLRSASEPVRC